MRCKFQTTSVSAERQAWIPEWDKRVVAVLCAVCAAAGQAFACELSRGKHSVVPNGGVELAPRPKSSAQSGVAVGSRERIEMLLAELDPASEQAADAVPGLLAALRNSETDATLRERSAAMLGRIGEPARGAVTVLIDILDRVRLSKPSVSPDGQS